MDNSASVCQDCLATVPTAQIAEHQKTHMSNRSVSEDDLANLDRGESYE